jgi:REP element-mobilizing transposase RayT
MSQSESEVRLAHQVRKMIGCALIDYFTAAEYTLLAVSIAKTHAHLLVELPDNILKIRTIVGHAKRLSSRAVKKQIPGSVWAGGGTFKLETSRDHQRTVYNYILYKQGPDAWTWSFRDPSNKGQFRRSAQ